jgi:hypothetical protein
MVEEDPYQDKSYRQNPMGMIITGWGPGYLLVSVL